jgi:hypothetical protein
MLSVEIQTRNIKKRNIVLMWDMSSVITLGRGVRYVYAVKEQTVADR